MTFCNRLLNTFVTLLLYYFKKIYWTP